MHWRCTIADGTPGSAECIYISAVGCCDASVRHLVSGGVGFIDSHLIDSILVDVAAAVILTDWDEFFNLDWSTIAGQMNRPGWVFDPRGVVDLQDAAAHGLQPRLIGCGGHL